MPHRPPPYPPADANPGDNGGYIPPKPEPPALVDRPEQLDLSSWAVALCLTSALGSVLVFITTCAAAVADTSQWIRAEPGRELFLMTAGGFAVAWTLGAVAFALLVIVARGR